MRDGVMVVNGSVDEQTYRESLRTEVMCMDMGAIWIVDGLAYSLHRMDMVTFEVVNILDASQIFKRGYFRPISMVKWGDNLIIVPFEVDRYWVVYNTVTAEIQYRKVISSNWTTTGIHIIGGKAFMGPATSMDPVLIVDLDSFECIQVIDVLEGIFAASKSVLESWEATVVQDNLIFPMRNTKFIFKIGQRDQTVYAVDIPYNIGNIGGSSNEIVILPTEGNCLYMADMEGQIIDRFCMNIGGQPISVSAYAKIISAGQYLFLLPFLNKEICVYDRDKKQTIKINTSEMKLESSLEFIRSISYWEYYRSENEICLMPSVNKYLSIRLDTLEWEEKDILLPALISGREISYWNAWNKTLNRMCDDIKFESGENIFEIWLKYVKTQEKRNSVLKQSYGKTIWTDMLRINM